MTNNHANHSVNHSGDEAAARALYQQFTDGWTRAVALPSLPSSRRMATSLRSTVHTSKGGRKSLRSTSNSSISG
jgi:hypothetical protein